MTQEEKIAMVQTMLDNDAEYTSALVTLYLTLSQDKIVNRLYPFSENNTLPSAYDILQCELATRMLLRRGGEGEITHVENGITHQYGSVDDEDILSRVTPYARIV